MKEISFKKKFVTQLHRTAIYHLKKILHISQEKYVTVKFQKDKVDWLKIEGSRVTAYFERKTLKQIS